jgi:hypothetical protein
MPIQHTKPFGVYHWDTFDNATLLLREADTLEEAETWVMKHYGDRVRANGADRADIVDLEGNVVKKFNVG